MRFRRKKGLTAFAVLPYYHTQMANIITSRKHAQVQAEPSAVMTTVRLPRALWVRLKTYAAQQEPGQHTVQAVVIKALERLMKREVA